METITVTRDKALDLRFEGALVCKVSSEEEFASRWTELFLYRTEGGKFVGQIVGVSTMEGENNRYKAEVCEDETAVIQFFGAGWLAKELYREANIDAVEIVK